MTGTIISRNHRYVDGEERPLLEISSLLIDTLVNWESRRVPALNQLFGIIFMLPGAFPNRCVLL